MDFSFLAPTFLAGLAALAVPILIHLTHRERKDAVAFPSLMFVRKIPYRTVRRQKIRNWLLFVLRVAAVVLVVSAFARPLIDDSSQLGGGTAGARELVILLDRSHSMAYADHWERAVSAARRAVDGMGPEDLATLVAFDEGAEAVTQPTADRALLLGALSETRVGSGRTRYGPALQLAGEIVGRSNRPRTEVLLITDFQSTGWDARQAVKLPAATRLRYVDLSDPEAANLAVVGVSLNRDWEEGRQRAAVAAQVVNSGERPHEDVVVALEVDGEILAQQSVDLHGGERARIQFGPVALPQRTVRGVVRAGDDALAADNAFQFVVSPQDPVSVLWVEPRNAGSDHSLYFVRALAVGTDPEFQVAVESSDRISVEDLEGRSVVVLSDVPFPVGSLGERLVQFVREGGGLLVLLGRRSVPDTWSERSLDLLPGTFGAPIDRAAEGGGTLSHLNYDHPALRLFREPRSGDFTSGRFFRYRRLEVQDPSAVLARFDDGATALAESRHGDGRVMVWASGLENFWNDLVLQPVFLPFTHQLIRYLAAYEEPEYWYRVGDVIDMSQIGLQDNEDAGGTEVIVEQPSGRSRLLRPSRESRYFALDEAGFYQVRESGGGRDWFYTAAANIEPAEADLSVLDPNELANAVTVASDGPQLAAEATVLPPEERERRQGLWWYLLAGATALLVIEAVLANRASLKATS
jgi:hypothetical protein